MKNMSSKKASSKSAKRVTGGTKPGTMSKMKPTSKSSKKKTV